MTPDALAKRWFPGIVCLLIAVGAYFQASGFASLTADLLTPEPASTPRQAAAASTARLDPMDHATSAAPILARNPFDSVTGPLDRDTSVPTIAEPDVQADDPLKDPACDSGRVLLIAAADDPDWSFAVLSTPAARPVLRRRGDDVGDHRLLHIGWDRVWLTSAGTRCQLRLGSRDPAAKLPLPVTPTRPMTGGAKLPPEIASKIQKVSEREFNVDRSAVDVILERQAELMRSSRLVPVKNGSKVVGLRLQRIASGSLFDTLGLMNGDRIETINGFELTDPQKALEAYARLRVADQLRLAITRDGKQMTVDYHIR